MTSIERLTRQELLDRAHHETDAFMDAVAGGAVYVVEGLHARERIRAFRERASRFAAAQPPSWHPCLDGVPDHHRIVDDHPQAWVKSRMHGFYFHAFNGNAALFDEFADVFALKHALAGAPPGAYLRTTPSDGVIARVVCNRYPRGGGYLAEHEDPATPFARLQTLVQASDPGEDYTEGGLYVRDERGEQVWLDEHTRMGDMLVLSPAVPHGVAPVDPGATLDWSRMDGRWMIIPIVIRSDHDAVAADKPRQLA